jgi:glycosyltransferase involved in cell wall biosynthesis
LKNTSINKSKISIVTVCKNAELFLEETITSVINQIYDNVEYIIIDGKSTDFTINIIKKYQDKIKYWISEEDKGIYDAMNKSLNFVEGEWVIFMNAGDLFFNNLVLHNIFSEKHYDNLLIYGDHSYFRNNVLYKKKPYNIYSIWKRMPICHQSMFIKSAFLKKYPFNIEYKYAADYEFLYKLFLLDKTKILYLNYIFSIIQLNGISEKNSSQTYIEYSKISLKLRYTIKKKFYFFYIINLRKVIMVIKKLIND